MSEMSFFRKEDLSVYHYMKEIALANFIETEEEISLELMPEICDIDSFVYEAITTMEPGPTERGRGWVYFDCVSGTNCNYVTVTGTDAHGNYLSSGVPEQSNRITVYENGTPLSASEYMIDYIDGRIITTRKLTNPTITYDWYLISLVDEWATIEASKPPVVVIDMHGVDKAGYQLGGGKKSTRKVDFHIFAGGTAERNDIAEAIYDSLYLRSCLLQDFPNGSPLDYDGTFYGRRSKTNKLTYLYNRTPVSNTSRLYFENVTARHVNLPLLMSRGRDEVLLSDLNAYRSKVSCDLVLYDDRIPQRVYPTCEENC
jgi:hypothetical protein